MLSQASETLSRVQELAVQFRNDTNGAADRTAGAKEVRQLFAQLQQSANTELNGQPIFTGTSTHGRATGLAITTPMTLTNGSNDTLIVTVDGTASGTIDLTSGTESLTGTQLAARVQSRINADTALVNAGKSVTVTFDDRLVIASGPNGTQSSVRVTEVWPVRRQDLRAVRRAVQRRCYRNSGSTVGNTGELGQPGPGRRRQCRHLDDYVIRFTRPLLTMC